VRRSAQRQRDRATRRVPLEPVAERGYDTTLVGGDAAKGEVSMAFVAVGESERTGAE